MTQNTELMLKSLLKEPLIIFFLLSGVLFLVDAINSSSNDTPTIKINEALRNSIFNNKQSLLRRELTEAERIAAVDEYIQEQIMLAEAEKLGLDNDFIIQKKLLSKVKFVWTDDVQKPDQKTLIEFYLLNKKDYETPETYDFNHIYLGKSLPSDDTGNAIRLDDLSLSELLPFSKNANQYSKRYENLSLRDIKIRLGQEIAKEFQTPQFNKLIGPIKSSKGFHMIQISATSPASIPPFNQVSHFVKDAWLKAEKNKLINQKVSELKAEYTIVTEPF